ncbi:unnamed protein product [Nesidiocoris tenuis]|nr:unnamed protein product [Nesidiocoris tenuis]
MSVDQGLQIIVSHVRNANLGGQDIIDLVTEHLRDEFKRKYYLDPKDSRKAMWKLRVAATGIVHTLSTVPSSSRFIESVCEGVDFNPTISQARFEALLQPLLPKLIAPIQEALQEAAVDANQVSKVVLCGGVLKVPKIRSTVSSLFNCDVCSKLNPDEVLASGAAQQAGLIGDRRDIGLHVTKVSKHVPFLAENLKVKINDEEMIIEHGVMPITQKKKITLDDTKIVLTAKQERNPPFKSFAGEGVINCSESGEVELDLRITT